jgi:hypothetical protein
MMKAGGGGEVQMPPTTSGMKYQVRLRKSWKTCRSVVRVKAATKMVAAMREGV